MENLKSSKQLCIQGLEQLKVTGKPIVKGTAGSGQEAKVWLHGSWQTQRII